MENTRINEMVKDTTNLVSKELTLDPKLEIKIVEAKNPKALTDLHGVGAFCPSSDLVQISFDTNHPSYPEKSISAGKLALIHELHHASKRYEGVSIDTGSLYETFLYEGQADRFVYKLTGEYTTWIEQTIKTNIANEYMDKFRSEENLPTTPKLYKKWFLGETSKIPKWTGYIIGYKIAQQ
jgi:hypothetical protein